MKRQILKTFKTFQIYGSKDLRIQGHKIYEIMIPEITNLSVSQLWILNLLLFVLLLYKSIISNFALREITIMSIYIINYIHLYVSKCTLKFAAYNEIKLLI